MTTTATAEGYNLDSDPPDWERPTFTPAPSGPVFQAWYVCDRCGAVVADGPKHSDWHALLAAESVLMVAALVTQFPGMKLPPDIAKKVAWAKAQAAR